MIQYGLNTLELLFLLFHLLLPCHFQLAYSERTVKHHMMFKRREFLNFPFALCNFVTLRYWFLFIVDILSSLSCLLIKNIGFIKLFYLYSKRGSNYTFLSSVHQPWTFLLLTLSRLVKWLLRFRINYISLYKLFVYCSYSSLNNFR